MGQPGGGSAANVGAVLASFSTSSAAASGGWCAAIGKPAGSVLTAGDVGTIVNVVFGWMIKNGYGDPTGSIPAPWAAAVFAQMSNTLHGGLDPLVGKTTCDGLPANLHDVPGVAQATPPSDVGQVFNVLLDWTGLGQLVVKAAVLIGILALALIAIRRLI